jgi:hypothetical protein
LSTYSIRSKRLSTRACERTSRVKIRYRQIAIYMNLSRRAHLILPVAAVLLSDPVSRVGLLLTHYLGAWGDLIKNPFVFGYLLIALVTFVLLNWKTSALSPRSAAQDSDHRELRTLRSRLATVQLGLFLVFGWTTYQAVTAEFRPLGSQSEIFRLLAYAFIVHAFVWVGSMLIANITAVLRHNSRSGTGERA